MIQTVRAFRKVGPVHVPWLRLWSVSDFPAAKSSMVLHLDTTLISPQYVSVAYPGFQRGVLKVRPHTKSGGALQVGYTKSGGGGGGGGGALQVRYTKSGGGGGGGPFRFRSDTFGHTENIYMYLPKVGTCRYFLVETTYVTQAENFTYIGCIA